MIPLTRLRDHGIAPEVVVHVGAHLGEEAPDYAALGVREVLWCEADPALLPELAANVAPYGHQVAQALLAAEAGRVVPFHVADSIGGTNRGMSSSVLDLGTHRDRHPDVVFTHDVGLVTARLDDVVADRAPHFLESQALLVNIDVQGYEAEVFRGAPRVLATAAAIIAEVNCDELYRGTMLFQEWDEWMVSLGFECVDVAMANCARRDGSLGTPPWLGWGDGWWKRTPSPRRWAETHPDDAADWYANVERAP